MASLPAATAVAAPPQARIDPWKQKLFEQQSQLRQEFFSRKSAAELLRRQTAMIDRQLKEIWASSAMPRGVALAAVGGYGRSQQFPCSDVDLLILLAKPSDVPLARKLEELVSVLWDIGLEVGHSVRTIEECAALAASDITVQTTLLQARLLAGKRDLYARFVKRMRDGLDPAAFLQAKLLE